MIPISIPGFTDPISSWSHLLMAGVALVGAVFLCMRGRGNFTRMVALSVFSFALIFLFSMSGVFHLLDRGGAARDVLQRLDHAAIWVLIAGTFTPVQVILVRGAWRWALLLFVWTVAITGLVLEVVFFNEFPEWLLVSLFLGLGWFGALSVVRFTRVFKGASIKWIFIGGVCYSVGACIDFARWPVLVEGVIGPHEIFHIFVALGAIAHWIFIYSWSDHPIGNELHFNVRVFPDGHVVAEAVGDALVIEAGSVSEFKHSLPRRVSEKFHSSITPLIRLRYFEEEMLSPPRMANRTNG